MSSVIIYYCNLVYNSGGHQLPHTLTQSKISSSVTNLTEEFNDSRSSNKDPYSEKETSISKPKSPTSSPHGLDYQFEEGQGDFPIIGPHNILISNISTSTLYFVLFHIKLYRSWDWRAQRVAVQIKDLTPSSATPLGLY